MPRIFQFMQQVIYSRSCCYYALASKSFHGILGYIQPNRVGEGEGRVASTLFIYLFYLFIYLFSHSQNLIQREQKLLIKL